MEGLQSIWYALRLKDMSNESLFYECMNELYPNSRPATKSGCLIHELMERIEPEKQAPKDDD